MKIFGSQAEYRLRTDLHGSLPLYFQPWWLDAACGSSWDVRLLEEQGETILVWPFQIEQKWRLTLLRNPPMTPYLGPFFLKRPQAGPPRWDFEERAIRFVLQSFPRWGFFQMETMPGFDNFQLFSSLGFQNTVRLTYRLDLRRDANDLFAAIHPRKRNYIRKAARQLEVREEANPDLDLFERWHRRSFLQKRKGYPFSMAYVGRLIRAAAEHGNSQFLTASLDGRILAMIWTPYDKTSTYQLASAYADGSGTNGAMDLLVWEAIRNAQKRGGLTYDFEGSMEPGIEAYFRKFGGNRDCFFSFQQNNSLLWKWKLRLIG